MSQLTCRYLCVKAKHAENADIEIVLVGDSLGMVVLGYDTTQPVTMEDMLHHSKAVIFTQACHHHTPVLIKIGQ